MTEASLPQSIQETEGKMVVDSGSTGKQGRKMVKHDIKIIQFQTMY